MTLSREMSDENDDLHAALAVGDLHSAGEIIAAELGIDGEAAERFAAEWAENYGRCLAGPMARAVVP